MADFADVIALAYELGRDSVLQARAEFWDDSLYVAPDPPRFPYEQRVRHRVEEFERCAVAVAQQIREELAGAPRGPWRCA